MNSYLMALVGGILIGVSSSTLLLGLGRITGISGILGSALAKPQKELLWKYAFLAGLLVGGSVLSLTNPSLFNYSLDFHPLRVIVAGLLVGFGTRLGSGCTSGHGVCGLPRLAKRSLIATCLFMGMGILTVSLMEML